MPSVRWHLIPYLFLVSSPLLSYFPFSWKYLLNKSVTLEPWAQKCFWENPKEKSKHSMALDMWCLAAFWMSVIYFAQGIYLEHFVRWTAVQDHAHPWGHIFLSKYSFTCYPVLRPISFCQHLAAAAKISQATVDKNPAKILFWAEDTVAQFWHQHLKVKTQEKL